MTESDTPSTPESIVQPTASSSEPTTELVPSISEPAATLSPVEALRKKLNDSPVPLLLKEIAKDLTQKGRKAPPPPDFAALLAEEEQAGQAFRHPSGKEGAERYWAKDEKQVIREAVLNAAAEPKKLNDLKKLAKDATKADKAFAETIVDELVVAEQLHKQSSAGNPLYGAVKSRALDKGVIRDEILSAAASPQKAADLVKAAKQATNADKALVESILTELIEAKQLHPQSAGNKPLYGKEPLPERNVREPVAAALLAVAETPDTGIKLIAAAQKATGADKAFVESVFNELIESNKLFAQAAAKKQLYGTKEPPHPLEVDPGKKAFTAFVKAAQKVLEVAPQVQLDEVFPRLRKALEQQPKAPQVEEMAVPVSHAPVSPPPSPEHEPAVTTDSGARA